MADGFAGTPDVPLLGLRFAPFDAGAAAARIASRPADASFAYVVTPNADHLTRLSRQPDLRAIYDAAWLRLLDSRVVGRAAGALGLSAPPVATGSDLTEVLLRRHLAPGERVTIVGLRADHLPALVARCGLAPPAHYDPPMGFDRMPGGIAAAVRFVRDNPARLIFLAVGSPRQERLAAAIAASGGCTGTALCVGASLDFLAGVQQRAPGWMQRAGLEWAFRLGTEPRRLARRYVLDSPPVFAMLLRERLARG